MFDKSLKSGVRPRDRRLLKLERLFEQDDAFQNYWTYDVVRRAILAANTGKKISVDQLTRQLRVLPPRTPYYIEPHGGYLGSPRAVATEKLVERPHLIDRAKKYLVDELTRVVSGDGPTQSMMESANESDRSENRVVLIGMPPRSEWWVKANHHQTQPKEPHVCTPTFEDFVVYAIGVIQTKPWHAMLRRCAAPGCDKFFLTPKKRQRPIVTCPDSDQCREDRINYRRHIMG